MERSKPLHDFTFSPGWGNHQQLKCMDPTRAISPIDSGDSFDSGEEDYHLSAGKRRIAMDELERPRSSDDSQRRLLRFKLPSTSPSPAKEVGVIGKFNGSDEDEISATREKLVSDLQTEVSKMKDEIFNKNSRKEQRSPVRLFPSPIKADAIAVPLSNLKTKQESERTAPPPNAIKVGGVEGSGGGGMNAEAEDPRCEKKSMRPRRNSEKKEERPKFSVSLSRSEIEEDFIAMTGKKPPRKPKKRPKAVQNKLDSIFPGLWLTEVNADLYKVNENGKS